MISLAISLKPKTYDAAPGFIGAIMSFMVTVGLIAIVGSGLFTFWAVQDLPTVEKVLTEGVNPSKWTQVFARDGSPIWSYGKFHHKSVPLSQVSPFFIDALIATEDRRYYQHFGIDPIGIVRAVTINLFNRKLSEGASTLTQQLAKNVFLTNERSFKRKIREAVLAVKLEQELSKQEILELYVNNTYFGEGAYGIQAASEVYFRKTPAELTIDEAALHAGLPQAPSRFNPHSNPEVAKNRRNEVLANLFEVGKINDAQLKELQAKPLYVSTSGRDLSAANRAPYFNQYVLQQVQGLFDLDEQRFWQSGLKIYTTLDFRAQQLAERAIQDQMIQFGKAGTKDQASLVTLEAKTGGILAYIGGRSYAKSQFDRVTQAIRSPGSLFKVFTYTSAIEQGYQPDRVYLDEPISVGDWTPKNYDGKHHGYMTLAMALVKSNNIVAVKLLQELSAPTVIELAQRMGIHSHLDNNLALTLGGSGVNLMEVTSAIGVLANQGNRVEPFAIQKIYDRDNKVIYEYSPMSQRVVDRSTVDTLISMMMQVVTQGTGKAADIGRPVAGKTGTSDENRDGWFVGFTPKIVTGVWVGRDDNQPSPGLAGGGLPASIWRAYQRPYLANRALQSFDIPYSKMIAPEAYTKADLNKLSEYEANNPLAGEARSLPPAESTNDLQADPSLPVDNGTIEPSDEDSVDNNAAAPEPTLPPLEVDRRAAQPVSNYNASNPPTPRPIIPVPSNSNSQGSRKTTGAAPAYLNSTAPNRNQRQPELIPVPSGRQ